MSEQPNQPNQPEQHEQHEYIQIVDILGNVGNGGNIGNIGNNYIYNISSYYNNAQEPELPMALLQNQYQHQQLFPNINMIISGQAQAQPNAPNVSDQAQPNAPNVSDQAPAQPNAPNVSGQAQPNAPNVSDQAQANAPNMNMNISLQNAIVEQIRETIERAYNIMFEDIPVVYTELLESILLENMRYDDDDVNTTLTHTIRMFISRTTISFDRVVAVILNYASRESDGIYINNLLFVNNYDMVHEICIEEMRKTLTRSYRMIQFISLFVEINGNQEMENVKLVMKKEDIISMFPEKDYNTYEQDIKTQNERCIFCQENFTDTDKCRKLNCDHVFHTSCIDEWLENQNYKCPCCRAEAGPHHPKE
jgi:hypothetical protein